MSLTADLWHTNQYLKDECKWRNPQLFALLNRSYILLDNILKTKLKLLI